jgi:radical SAM protein with 4Fe4S-binding SPASM domain
MITAYVKPTNYCNVGCTHCYLPEEVRANKHRMSRETLEQLCALLLEMQAGRRGASGIHILWHGGEPMTIPVEWFWEACELFDARLPGHSRSMQTSLIPYKPAFAPLIKQRFASEIGSSIDFSQRKIKGEVANYHKLWMEKVEACREEGILVIPGVVPTRAECGREAEIVAWFTERGFPLFNIDRYNAYAAHFPDRPTNREHAQFLIALHDALLAELERTGRAPLVGAIRAGIDGVLFGRHGDRWGTTCQHDFVVVEPDGGLNTCPDKSTVEPPHSHVKDGFKAFAASGFRRKWLKIQAVSHKMPHCETCENNHFCKSGCPITPNGPPEGEEECSGYKTYLSHIRRQEKDGRGALLRAYIAQQSLIGASANAFSYGQSEEAREDAGAAA